MGEDLCHMMGDNVTRKCELVIVNRLRDDHSPLRFGWQLHNGWFSMNGSANDRCLSSITYEFFFVLLFEGYFNEGVNSGWIVIMVFE